MDIRVDKKIRWLARLLDSSIPVGTTGWRVGLDPLLGLIPGVGDSIGAILSSVIVITAARSGASRWVLFRMVGNIAIESLVGLIPLVGDLFDFVFKANERNVALLDEARAVHPADGAVGRVVTSTILIGLLLTALFLATLFAGIYVLLGMVSFIEGL